MTGRARPALRSVRVIAERELAEMFLNVPDSPGWKATLAVLDQEIQEGVERCLDERLTNEQMRFRLGGVHTLLEFKATLEEHEMEARRKPSEESAK